MQVPLDYANPSGRKIGIALDRHPAESGSKIGSLLANPGGPGASGIDDLTYFVSLMSNAVLARFDIVSFDPRGVGRSAPVDCLTGPELDKFIDLDPAPTTATGFQALVDSARAFDQGCQSRSGSLLPFVGTLNAARDMEQIRQAVGDAKLSYIGFSYGTYLGATYAELFPTHIRAMVLDGAVNPAKDAITANIEQAAGFDKELGAFFAWCQTATVCSWRPGGDLHAAYDAIVSRIRTQRLPGIGNRTVGPGEAFYGVAVALYDEASWPQLAISLVQASQGDGSGLLRASDIYTDRQPDGTYSNQLEANNAINCVDVPWPRDPNAILAAAPTARQQAPEFGVADLYGGLTCSVWPVPAQGKPHPIAAAGSPPIVVVGSTGDPATPYADAQALAGQLQHGLLITRVGDGHTGYRASECVRTHVDAYLLNGTTPSAGISCPSP